MAVVIKSVEKKSPAYKANIEPGDILLTINDNDIIDILDYRFYETEERLKIEIQKPDKTIRTISIKKSEYDPIGLDFDTYLMDKQRNCKNKCVFCFIDQLPKGLRESLYFKDDDARMSFLFGNYITLTNLQERDVERIIKMHISPVNVSIHTTNPDLRVKMMLNKNAGKSLDIVYKLAEQGIKINTQIVLCKGLNDKEELRRTIGDLEKLYPAVQSIAVVPVGLTKYRDGLYPLEPFNKQDAQEVIDLIDDCQKEFFKQYNERIAYAADEFYLKADRGIPQADFYGDFAQLENGVGLLSCLRSEFLDALEHIENGHHANKNVSIATGAAAYDFLCSLVDEATKKCNNLNCKVYKIVNDFFGHNITVAGLVTGQDLIRQLKGKDLGDTLLIPSVMLRHERDMFLDDVTIDDVERELNVKVKLSENDGYQLLEQII